MTSIKVKFRSSIVENKEGSLYYQLIHCRKVRLINTHYKLYVGEWDMDTERIISTESNNERKIYLKTIESRMTSEINKLRKIILNFEQKKGIYSLEEVIHAFENPFYVFRKHNKDT